jgi:hypothetical protein
VGFIELSLPRIYTYEEKIMRKIEKFCFEISDCSTGPFLSLHSFSPSSRPKSPEPNPVHPARDSSSNPQPRRSLPSPEPPSPEHRNQLRHRSRDAHCRADGGGDVVIRRDAIRHVGSREFGRRCSRRSESGKYRFLIQSYLNRLSWTNHIRPFEFSPKQQNKCRMKILVQISQALL